MVLGIDIDDTITETTITANRYLKDFTTLFRDYHELPKEEYHKFLNKYLTDIVKNNILKEGVKEAFTYFKSLGYKIIIITARNDIFTPNVKKLTKEFLDNNKIYYDKLVFDDSGIGDKSSYAKENNVDIFIDDKEGILDIIAKKGNIECLRFTNDQYSKYKTFNNWYAITFKTLK